VSNAEVRNRTGMAKLEEIFKERRLRLLGHVIRTEDCRIPNQALNWNLSSMNRKQGRPQKTSNVSGGALNSTETKPGKTGRTLSEGI